MNERYIFLVDIDGTVADLKHRLHFIESKPADWDGFFAACPADTPISGVIDTVRLLKQSGAEIFMVSGRSDAIRNQTIQWLDDHSIPCDGLYMRKAGDHRTDDIVKGELLDRLLADQLIRECHISAAFEDRDQVVAMYRARGLRVFQVAEGSF